MWPPHSGNRSKLRARLSLEQLEDRTVPSAGMPDPTFTSAKTNFPASITDEVFGPHAVALQADGKIIVAASNDTSGAATAIRFTSTGTPDSSFGPDHDGFVPIPGMAYLAGAAVLPDGKILVAGSTPRTNDAAFAVARLNGDGTLDTNFGAGGSGVQFIDFSSPGTAVFAELNDLVIQSIGDNDYQIVLAGYDNATNSGVVARLNSNGTPDTSFAGDGKLLLPDLVGIGEVALQSDKILLDGSNFLVRLNNNGSPDPTFHYVGVGNTLGIGALTAQPDGKIVVCLSSGLFDGGGKIVVQRLNSDGSLDAGFGDSGQELIDFNSDFTLTGDLNAEVPGGAAALLQEQQRFSQDGYTFVGQEKIDAGAKAVAVQPDGKIVVAGFAGPELLIHVFGNGYDGQVIETASNVRSAVVRLDSNGSLDTDYGSGGKQLIDYGGGEDLGSTGESFAALAIQPDGNAVLAGTTFHDPGWSILTARYLGGAMNVTTQAAVANQLQQLATTADLSGQPGQVAFQVNTVTDASTVVQAINALAAQDSTFNGTVTLNLAPITYGGLTVTVPNGMTLVIGTNSYGGGQQATIDPDGPAFTLVSGNAIISNVTFLTTGDAPTILVQGGHLTLRNDVIQESTGSAEPAVWATGGTVDLGTAADPGHNTLNVNGTGTLVRNDTAALVTALGNTWEVNGTAAASPQALVSGQVGWIVYGVQTLTDLSAAFHAGRTIPIKLELLGVYGNDVSSAGITVTAVQLDRVSADGALTPVALQDAGNSNPQDLFRYDATLGGYVFNLSTRGLGAGTYVLDWTADGDPTQHLLWFQLV
jgi:uncharacterized delta-60 repeat protein